MPVKDWKTGDVVRLKSGGPRMTVVKTANEQGSGDTVAVCAWFDMNGQIQTTNCPPALLVPVAEPPDPDLPTIWDRVGEDEPT